jgi:hypothetical protein
MGASVGSRINPRKRHTETAFGGAPAARRVRLIPAGPDLFSDYRRRVVTAEPSLQPPPPDADAKLPPPADEPPIGTDIVPPEGHHKEEKAPPDSPRPEGVVSDPDAATSGRR